MGCEIAEGDLLSDEVIQTACKGCDSAFHIAADYRVGIPERERAGMREANVRGTEVVLDAAIDAGTSKIVYVSTVGYFGNTRGRVIDESFERTDLDWLSAYDETKYLAHEVAKDRIAKGAPVLIAQPGGVYGPGDASDLATLIERVRRRKVPFLPMGETGFNFMHVDDVAQGIVLVHDKGRVGQAYVLGGEITTLRGFVDMLCKIEGHRSPGNLPTAIVKAFAPLGPVIGRFLGIPPNIKEMIKAGDGVTYWAADDKARSELGYSPRGLEEGLRQTLAALG
jgi:nucleoside-diphosphate-sugar epimerase